MTDFAGRFIWYELMTTDSKAAQAFYGRALGWATQPGPVPDMDYTLFTANGAALGGVMGLCDEARQAGARPAWGGVIAVADVDEAADRAVKLGGSVRMPPADIPGVGRYANVADPQSAGFALFKPSMPGPDHSGGGSPPDAIGWRELHAADWQAAFAFYEAMFGWQKAEAHDMGAMGTYQTFSAGGQPIGGMFTKPAAEPVPYWLYYFVAGDIDAAASRVAEGGGKVLNGPMEVPGGGWIVHATDPQGPMFGLLGTRG